jgi:glycogen operon protein
MLWFSGKGHPMSIDDWHNPERRTLQRLSLHLMNDGSKQGVLLVINGSEQAKNVTLPSENGIKSLELLWDSALELPPRRTILLNPGSSLRMVETSLQLFLVR